MKLLCFEMMDLGKAPGGANGAASGAPPSPVRDLLARRADELAALLADRTEQIFAGASAAIAAGQPPNTRACKYALNCLMNVFSSAGLPAGVAPPTLRRLVRALLRRLVDDQLPRVPEGEALLKALNVLMLKLLENSDRNASFDALLRLLLEPPAPAGAGAEAGAGGEAAGGAAAAAELEARWGDLVVKCLIKITKALPATIDVRAALISLCLSLLRFGRGRCGRQEEEDQITAPQSMQTKQTNQQINPTQTTHPNHQTKKRNIT